MGMAIHFPDGCLLCKLLRFKRSKVDGMGKGLNVAVRMVSLAVRKVGE